MQHTSTKWNFPKSEKRLTRADFAEAYGADIENEIRGIKLEKAKKEFYACFNKVPPAEEPKQIYIKVPYEVLNDFYNTLNAYCKGNLRRQDLINAWNQVDNAKVYL